MCDPWNRKAQPRQDVEDVSLNGDPENTDSVEDALQENAYNPGPRWPIPISEDPDADDGTSFSWRNQLERNVREWLDALPGPPVGTNERPEPDLFSFFEQLSSLRHEVRQGVRKGDSDLKQIVQSVDELSGTAHEIGNRIGDLNKRVTGAIQANEADSTAHRFDDAAALLLTDMLDRMFRLDQAMGSPPEKHVFGGHARWTKSWLNLREGFGILRSHMEELLRSEGVVRIETEWTRFDPETMTAVAAEEAAHCPRDAVLEELRPGYLRDGRVLKLAEVKVAKAKESR